VKQNYSNAGAGADDETTPLDRSTAATGPCWVLTDGKAGTENQCIGLAEALGLTPQLKRLHPRAPWRWPPASLWQRLPPAMVLRLLAHGGDALEPPWPRLLIASGKPSVGPALAIRRLANGQTFAVQVQDPRVDPAMFDLVAAPRHDHLGGANVIATRGALHRVTPDKLDDARARFAPQFAALPRPLVAVLIGGTSNSYRMTRQATLDLASGLRRVCKTAGAGLVVTASRRTGAANEAALREALTGLPVAFWDGRGDNPYLGYLALADAIVVTEDSVSMTSEAASTGKPVYVAALPGGAPKFDEFHAALRADGATRPFAGALEVWSYEPLRDTAIVAAEVVRRLGD
jgi:mitochondrial fission protein ELM1